MVVVTQVNVLKNNSPEQRQSPAPDRPAWARDWADSEFLSLPDVSGGSISAGAITDSSSDIPEEDTSEVPDPIPDDIPTPLKIALKFKKQGKLIKAEEMFRLSMSRNPNHHSVLFHYGQFLESDGKFESAYQYYLKALLSTENPEKSPAWRKRKGILPVVNRLDLDIVNRVNFKLSKLNETEHSNLKQFMEEINLEHIHYPFSSTSIALSCGSGTDVEGRSAESESCIGESSVILGINKGISYINETLVYKESITVEDIKDLHKVVMEPVSPSAAGRFREDQVYVGHHTPPPAADVKDLMEKLVALLQDPRKHPLHIAAFAHYRLINIQPFEDGNSRTARLLMNLILRKYRYPPIHIKQDNRGEYSEHLKAAHESDVRPFLRFIARAAESTIDDYLYSVNRNNSHATPGYSRNSRGI